MSPSAAYGRGSWLYFRSPAGVITGVATVSATDPSRGLLEAHDPAYLDRGGDATPIREAPADEGERRAAHLGEHPPSQNAARSNRRHVVKPRPFQLV